MSKKMASDNSTELLLDLLYDELSGEEADEARAQLAESAEASADLQSYQLMLGQVREAMDDVEPPSSLRANLLEAANKEVVAMSANTARAMRYPPPQEISLWKRLNVAAVAQVAAVAAILLVGAFTFTTFQDKEAPKVGAPTSSEVASNPANANGDGQALAAREQAESTGVKPGLEGQQIAMAESTEGESPSEAPSLRRGSGGSEWATAAKDQAQAGTKKEEKSKADKGYMLDGKQVAMAETSKNRIGGLDGNQRARRKRSAPKKKARRLDSYGGKKSAKSVDELFAKKPSADALEDSVAKGEAAPVQAKSGGVSISTVKNAYRRRDYQGTIENADALVQSKVASSDDKAVALEKKAQALERLGRFKEADQVYVKIQSQHGSYRRSAIAKQRRNLRSKIASSSRSNKKKAKKSFLKKNSSGSMGIPNSADEPAEKAPSSLK